MRRSEIPGWQRQRRILPGFAHCLDVYFRKEEPHWDELAAALHAQGTLPGLSPVPSSRTARVQGGRLGPNQRLCYVKQYLPRDPGDALKDLFRPSRARRALENEAMATAAGFHLPRSLCLIEEYRAGRLCYNALISQAIEQAPSVRDWLTREDLGLRKDRVRRRGFLRAFAREVGRWHRRGLYHGDLRFGNILCAEREGGFTFYWLDNERTRRYPALPIRRRSHNLMQLNYEPVGLSLTDRACFWAAYREAAAIPAGQEKEIARRVIRRTLRRWKKRGWA